MIPKGRRMIVIGSRAQGMLARLPDLPRALVPSPLPAPTRASADCHG